MKAEKNDNLLMATKRNDPDYEQVSGYIHKDLALKFRILCTTERQTQSDLLEEALNLLIESRAGVADAAAMPPETKTPPATKGKRGSS